MPATGPTRMRSLYYLSRLTKVKSILNLGRGQSRLDSGSTAQTASTTRCTIWQRTLMPVHELQQHLDPLLPQAAC